MEFISSGENGKMGTVQKSYHGARSVPYSQAKKAVSYPGMFSPLVPFHCSTEGHGSWVLSATSDKGEAALQM